VRDDTAASLARLVAGLIDYAGLFPPAGLSMAEAVERYAAYRRGRHAWALGRFIVPAARLDEFAGALRDLPVLGAADTAWPISVLLDWPPALGAAQVRSFAAAASPARVESIECKVATPEDIDVLATASEVERFAEVPITPVPVDLLVHAGETRCAAKLRTGGTSPQAFPSSPAVAAFLSACVGRGLPFKATAGLHHPVRSPHPVTYEDGAPCARMHGFLNVFLGAALLHGGAIGGAALEELLEDGDASAFLFEDGRAGWRGRWVTVEVLEAARRLARSFGSCSFEEPIDDLAALGLLQKVSMTR